MGAANDHLATKIVTDFQELYQNINDIEENTEFAFDEEGRLLLREKNGLLCGRSERSN